MKGFVTMNGLNMHPLTKEQSDFAAVNYGLVFSFLKDRKLDADEFHDIVILDFLHAVQLYDECPNLQAKPFEALACRMMECALRLHLQTLGGQGVRGLSAAIPKALLKACQFCVA